jgi:hypothetical protein
MRAAPRREALSSLYLSAWKTNFALLSTAIILRAIPVVVIRLVMCKLEQYAIFIGRKRLPGSLIHEFNDGIRTGFIEVATQRNEQLLA